MQDAVYSSDWRISLIPYDDPSKRHRVARPADILAPLGVLGFIIGVVLAVKRSAHKGEYLGVACTGLVVALAGVWWRARREHRGWEIVPAKCTDRELRRVRKSTGGRGHGGWTWVSRIVCELDYNGARIRVTPRVFWSSFRTEKAARRFLDRRISPAGDCQLHVNPKNPLQTELFDQGIKEKLIY